MKFQSYASNEVCVEFKVWAPTLDRTTHNLFLLGSIKELGAWDIENALQAYPTYDLHIWRVQAALPPMARFEWVWLMTHVRTKKVEWERPVKRHRAVSWYSAVLHTVWGEQEEVFLQSAANVELTTFKRVDDGYCMMLTGSSSSLGAWDLHNALKACEFPRKSGYWKVHFSFDASTNIEFKWAVVKDKDHTSVLVQEKLPHQLYGRRTWMRVAAPWKTTNTVVVDILPLDHTLDSKMGRTDIIVRERKRRLVEIRKWLVESRVVPASQPLGKTASLTNSSLKVSTSRFANASPSTMRQRDEAIEDSIKKRSESLTRAERLTKQLSRDFRNTPQVFAIKGAGQTEMPTDFMNADISNQVPLVDCSLVLLAAALREQEDYDTLADTAALTRKESLVSRSSVALSRSSIDKANFFPKDQRQGQDRLGRFFSALDKKFSAFSKKKFEETSGVPEVEDFIDRVTPATPLTWKMLTERDIEKTKHPVYSESTKPSRQGSRTSVSRYRNISGPAINVEAESDRPSLSEVFKQKDQQQILTEAAAQARGYFSVSTVSTGSSLNLPAVLGRDDTSKSDQDLREESNNRRKWETSREPLD